MKYWSLAVVALVIVGVAAVRHVNPNHELAGATTSSGVPVTTLHTPVTP
ncbi:hypothetical protein [Labrenzia sp. 011]|nr:hypothetical protein [Labrenzia sp. 011]